MKRRETIKRRQGGGVQRCHVIFFIVDVGIIAGSSISRSSQLSRHGMNKKRGGKTRDDCSARGRRGQLLSHNEIIRYRN